MMSPRESGLTGVRTAVTALIYKVCKAGRHVALASASASPVSGARRVAASACGLQPPAAHAGAVLVIPSAG